VVIGKKVVSDAHAIKAMGDLMKLDLNR
jgi:hypothetical protein